ncbi:hypothetical protein C8J57DRAFT_1260393 [Mycena rebaudengoi]|nr:hypothetical protein C8J57DRAFT_1260393 [Mycena rebaudengoi]
MLKRVRAVEGLWTSGGATPTGPYVAVKRAETSVESCPRPVKKKGANRRGRARRRVSYHARVTKGNRSKVDSRSQKLGGGSGETLASAREQGNSIDARWGKEVPARRRKTREICVEVVDASKRERIISDQMRAQVLPTTRMEIQSKHRTNTNVYTPFHFPPMPSLTRQQTLGSWWSDSNPNLRGPTVNLHAAAKPLMRFMYNRQALEFIGKIDGIPLSEMDWEIYGSYLLCEYVSISTKSAILDDLSRRARYDDALEVHSNMFHNLLQLLEVPVTMETKMREATLRILEILARSGAAAEATCGALVALLCDSRVPHVIDGALWVLSRVKFPPVISGVSGEPERLKHIVEMLEAPVIPQWHCRCSGQANGLNSVGKLLGSRPTNLYPHIFPMLEIFASYESTAMALVRMIPFSLLGALWRKSAHDLAPIGALERWWEDLVTAKLLSAPCKRIAEATCGSLVALMCDSHIPHVVDGTLWVLSRARRIKFPPITSGVSVEAKLLDRLSNMLEDSSTTERHYWWIIAIVSNLARHESTVVAVGEADILNSVEKLLRSGPMDLYEDIFFMLERLASHKSTVMAVVKKFPYDLPAKSSEWLDDDTAPYKTARVIDTLTRIARYPAGAEGVVTAKLLDNIHGRLQSYNSAIRLSTCRLLRALVGHESTVQDVIAIVPREHIVALLSYRNVRARDCAAEILREIDAKLERNGNN